MKDFPRRRRSLSGFFQTVSRLAFSVLGLAGLVTETETEAQRSLRVRKVETLDRGLVAIPTGEAGVFLSWRLLPTDEAEVGFDVYRREEGTSWQKRNESPLVPGTNWIDPEAEDSARFRYAVRSEVEEPPTSGVEVWSSDYLEIPIQTLEGYRAGDASVADLDGDHELELVLHQVSRPRDNSLAGVTGAPILDAYEFDGTHLWRIGLGNNIREGEHYTQFMVYDLDGDGLAEVVCKTADGTTDGVGRVIGDPEKDWRHLEAGSRLDGRILQGPEYLTVFEGKTGRALATVDYVPSRDPIDGWGGIGGNGGNDRYGNRCDRFLACVAYLDGVLPSVVMCRGVYGRTVLAAWDWRAGELTQRWVFDSGRSDPPYEDASPYSGMGGHSLSVADVDQDGRDEIVYQAMTVDDDGKGLYSTGRRHGDAMHLGDLYPDRPGLELFLITENENQTVRFQTPGVGVHDARTGELLWSHSPGVDVGSGMAADIDPRFLGYEAWGGPGGLRDSKGAVIGAKPRSTAWCLWWDGDKLRELLDRRLRVTKWDWENQSERILFDPAARGASRGPNLVGDLVGDWREELLLTAPDGQSLHLCSTVVPTRHRIPTLLSDSQYRLGIAWQNVVYNKPAHPSFYLGVKGKDDGH